MINRIIKSLILLLKLDIEHAVSTFRYRIFKDIKIICAAKHKHM